MPQKLELRVKDSPMFEDLRGFLAHLESQGQLLRVKDEVGVKYEIAAGMRKTSDIEGPALLFENVRGYPGWRVLGGLFATRKLVALGLGVPQEKMLERYLTLEDQRIAPEIVSTGPCKEIKWIGDQVDLAKLPIVTHASQDCGAYVTIGVQVGKDPDTSIRNLSIHRMLVLGKDRLSLWAPADHHLGRMILMAEEKKRGLEVATAIGVEPAIVVGSQAKVPFGIDEFHVAGGLRGAAVKLTKCETIDVEVPASAEVVIEGVTVPGERVADGPYGEYPGCYSEAKQAPVLKVTAITMRKDPIYQTALTGMPVTENHTLIEYGNAAVVYREVKKVVPEVRGVNMTPGGTFRHHAVVSIKKRAENEGRNVILALLSMGIGLKQIIVVDEDIDPRIACSTLDPSCSEARVTAGLGIDATAPMKERWRFEKVEIPGVDKVKYI
ncbi:MAG: UbiD family decarboxylase [Deltaproteobacteria bacterium]|nr:UbiD family decarboxylase [Deltaproteobacteria bacterium]